MCLLHMYTAGLCIWLCRFVYVNVCKCMYACVCVFVCGQKNCLFEVLPLENLPLVKHAAHSSSLTTKKVLTMLGDLFCERNTKSFYWWCERKPSVLEYCVWYTTLCPVCNKAMQCKRMQNAYCGMPTCNCSECRPTISLQVQSRVH